MTSRKKKFQTSPAKKGLSTLQKTLTFIGSILGIITASLTIYSFSSKAQTSSNDTSSQETASSSSSQESATTTEPASETVSGASQTSD